MTDIFGSIQSSLGDVIQSTGIQNVWNPIGDTLMSVFQSTGSFITSVEGGLSNIIVGIGKVLTSNDILYLVIIAGGALAIYGYNEIANSPSSSYRY